MSEFQFPDGFLWGSATSSHQVEGRNTNNDWWAWEQAGRVKESSGLACDQYHRFAGDFDLAASLHHTAHRFSVEWSRIEPAEGAFDDGALAHYREVLQALRQRRIEPIVTLHHYTNPQWVAKAGGWTSPKIVDWFARYTQRVVGALGDLVRYWVTINEPLVFVNMSYIEGTAPPGVQDMRQALLVTEQLLRAHAASYRVLHAGTTSAEPPQVSIAHYVADFWPCRRWWPPDGWVTHLTDRIFNAAFVEVLTEGRCSILGVRKWHIPEAKGTLDYLGLNFYRRQFMRYTPGHPNWPAKSCDLAHHARQSTERTAMGWDVHPDSFRRALVRWAGTGLPILVTENGTAMVDDARRWDYINRHLHAMAQAMQSGAKVFGYCYWSLLDNFEWAHGFGPRFGLIEVDYPTQRRTIRDSATRYAEVCRTNRLPL